MTTYTIPGFVIRYDENNVADSVDATGLAFTDIDGGAATLTYSLQSGGRMIAQWPQINPIMSGVRSAEIVGGSTLPAFPNSTTAYAFGALEWNGNTSYVFLYGSAGGDLEAYFFTVGGTPLPILTSVEAANYFFDRVITGEGPAQAGSGFGPGAVIDVRDIPGVVVSENDRVRLYAGESLDGGPGDDLFQFLGANEYDSATVHGGDGVDTLRFVYFTLDDIARATVRPDGIDLVFSWILSDEGISANGVERFQFSDGETLTLNELIAVLDLAPVIETGGPGPELLRGGSFDDRLYGLDGADTLEGLGGNDELFGDGMQPGYSEVTASQVYRLYQATLDRAPDRDGLLDWIDRIDTGSLTLPGAAAGFVNSAEFGARYGATTDTAFVTQLYENVLDRAPDAGGLQNWLDALTGGASRASVVLGFSESAEFIAATRAETAAFIREADPAHWQAPVFRLYQATLDREPDLAGLTGWIEQLAEGRSLLSVIEGFTGSPEFRAAYGALSDADFVTQLYRNVLDREPDATGLQGWLDAMAGGRSRAEVVRGFSESPEFIAAAQPALEAWMRAEATDDVLIGGEGNDTLAGGALADTFVFNPLDIGNDVILDFESWDTLRFNSSYYPSVDDVRAHMTQSGDDVLFEDLGVRVLILNADLSEISDVALGF